MMRALLRMIVIAALVPVAGCPLASDPLVPFDSVNDSVKPANDSVKPSESLDALVTRTLDQNRRQRRLSTETHGAWQILHGVLAYGDQFTIDTPAGEQPALEYLMGGGAVRGFEPVMGDPLAHPPRPGLRMAMERSTKIGQGHRDQWLAIFSQCDLPLDTELRSEGHTFTIDDWLRQAEYDVPRNLELEFSWSLIPMTTYRGTDHRWIAGDGIEYTTELLLESELQQDTATSVCGGTHRLIGIAMAVRKRQAEGKPINGIWAQADAKLREAIALAKQNQNPDGSYSSAYLHRPGWTRDLGETLGTTGHVLEFLAFAASDQTLGEPWVERTVRRVCGVLDQCRDVDLECGVLYHALHGLNEYQHRRSLITGAR